MQLDTETSTPDERPTVTNRNPAVDAFLDELDHPLADDVRSLRLAILADDDDDLVEWITPDRGTVSVVPAELASRRPALLELVARWVVA